MKRYKTTAALILTTALLFPGTTPQLSEKIEEGEVAEFEKTTVNDLYGMAEIYIDDELIETQILPNVLNNEEMLRKGCISAGKTMKRNGIQQLTLEAATLNLDGERTEILIPDAHKAELVFKADKDLGGEVEARFYFITTEEAENI